MDAGRPLRPRPPPAAAFATPRPVGSWGCSGPSARRLPAGLLARPSSPVPAGAPRQSSSASLLPLAAAALAGLARQPRGRPRPRRHWALRAKGGDDAPAAGGPPAIAPLEALPTPFPLARFEELGLPAASRFLWWEMSRSLSGRRKKELRSGLHALDLEAGWLEVSWPEAYAAQMAERRDVLAGDQRSLALVDDGLCLAAQAELLQLVAEHLAHCFPERFALHGAGSEQRLESLGEGLSWALADFAEQPLLLLGQLVQEDICMMREKVDSEGHFSHLFAAGVVMDSFNPVEKHLLPMLEMHGPVPNYREDLHESMSRVFSTLKRPFWRANFSLMEWREEEAEEEEAEPNPNELLQRLYLKVEYETLRRLPQNPEYLIFTIRPHISPLLSLGTTPLACAALAGELRRLPQALQEYKGFGSERTRKVVLGFLDHVCRSAGVARAAPPGGAAGPEGAAPVRKCPI